MKRGLAGNQAPEGDIRSDADARPDDVPPAEVEAIYREHYGFVWNCLRRLGVPDASVDDAAHDVFIVVARRLHTFEHRATLRSWLFAIALRVAKHHRRAISRHLRRVEALAQARELLAGRDELAQADSARLLRGLLEQLDDGKRAVYVLMELEGMTAPEVGEILGLKVPTVHSRLRLARARLQEALEALREEALR